MNYDFSKKRQYRREIQAFAERELTDIPRSKRRVAYLDTGQALETDFWVRAGYRPGNLHAINFNPAECAHITRKTLARGYRVNTYGRDAAVAIGIVLAEGGVDVVNLDFCGPLSKERLNDLSIISDLLIVNQDRGVISVTLLRGRESESDIREFLRLDDELLAKYEIVFERIKEAAVNKQYIASDLMRVAGLMEYLPWGRFRWNIYRSAAGHQTMLHLAVSWRKKGQKDSALARALSLHNQVYTK